MFEEFDEEDRLRLLDLVSSSDDLSQDELDFCHSQLSGHPILCALAANILCEQPKEDIEKVIAVFDDLPKANQRSIIPIFMISDYVNFYDFLIQKLLTPIDNDYVDFIMLCLSKSDYPFFPLVLSHLTQDNPLTQERMRALILEMGFGKWELPLASLPTIPFEQVFRDLFGDAKIESIKAN